MSKKKNTIQVKLIQGNNISNEQKPDIQSFNELVEKGNKVEEITRPGLIISKADYPIDVSYNGDTIVVSPRAQLKISDVRKLGELSKGLFLKNLSK